MKHFTKQNSSLCSLHGKIWILMFILWKEKTWLFSSIKLSGTEHSLTSNSYYMEFYRNYLMNILYLGLLNLNLLEKLKYDAEFKNRKSIQNCAYNAGLKVLIKVYHSSDISGRKGVVTRKSKLALKNMSIQ